VQSKPFLKRFNRKPFQKRLERKRRVWRGQAVQSKSFQKRFNRKPFQKRLERKRRVWRGQAVQSKPFQKRFDRNLTLQDNSSTYVPIFEGFYTIDGLSLFDWCFKTLVEMGSSLFCVDILMMSS